jgi:predicted NAD-dependent protein-ADP-ribosyltransferase YbiA (DUF1768 family)
MPAPQAQSGFCKSVEFYGATAIGSHLKEFLDMRVTLKPGFLVLAPENEAERESFCAWRESAAGHVFYFDGGTDKGGAMHDLGPREQEDREPINIVSTHVAPQWQPISNLAHTPFSMKDQTYASVEGFWQGLKFASVRDRARVAALFGNSAKRAAEDLPPCATFDYDGSTFATGGWEHRDLMLQACLAKFSQHPEARQALLSTGDRPLTHRVRQDSKTIPGVLMADIWMRVREKLRAKPIRQRI